MTHPGTDADPPIGRAATVGALIGFLVIGSAVAVTAMVLGESAGASVGLGAFVGMWGGVGFGAMLGGIITLSFGHAPGAEPARQRSTGAGEVRPG